VVSPAGPGGDVDGAGGIDGVGVPFGVFVVGLEDGAVEVLASTDVAGRLGAVRGRLAALHVRAEPARAQRDLVARVLSQLARSGITERRGRTLYVRDPERLDALANPEEQGW